MTYNDIKLATLQKMFHDVTTTEPTIVTKPYLDKMAYVCNCAIQKITAAGLGEKKVGEIISTVPVNLLGNSKEYYTLNRVTESQRYTAPQGKSYFFELCGKATVKIYVGDTLIKTVENTDANSFTKHKGVIENPGNSPVTLVFEGGNAYLKKNIAVYGESYEDPSEVYEISEIKCFDMSVLFNDFFKFDSENTVVCEGNNTAYGFSGESRFYIDGLTSGLWKVPYIAYPQIITADTPDDEKIKLPENLCGIIPYYIASELYLEDDSGLCVGWRNKFEAELSEYALMRRLTPSNRIKFVSLAGDLSGTV